MLKTLDVFAWELYLFIIIILKNYKSILAEEWNDGKAKGADVVYGLNMIEANEKQTSNF